MATQEQLLSYNAGNNILTKNTFFMKEFVLSNKLHYF